MRSLSFCFIYLSLLGHLNAWGFDFFNHKQHVKTVKNTTIDYQAPASRNHTKSEPDDLSPINSEEKIDQDEKEVEKSEPGPRPNLWKFERS